MEKLLEALKASERFRDPIHGFIRLTESEKMLIDTPIFQRLRRVNQLALTKYVYPSAEHSRFVHSLGVLHTATAIFGGLFNNDFSSSRSYADQIGDVTTLRYAALLHDIGHLPFSHAAENDWLQTFTHEDLGQHIINTNPDIAKILGDKKNSVIGLLSGSSQKHWYLHEIISGTLDADRADYLLRDSYMCGVKYGEYDSKRYFQSFKLKKINNEDRIVINERDIHVIESFILARHHYNMQVPYHRTRSGYDIILRRYLATMADKAKLTNFFKVDSTGTIKTVDFNKFEKLDDYSVFEQIKKDTCKNKFAAYLMREKHLIPIFDRSIEEDTFSCPCKKLDTQFIGCNFSSALNFDNDNKALFLRIKTLLLYNGFIKDEDFFTDSPVVKVANLGIKSDESVSAETDKKTLPRDLLWVALRDNEEKLIPISEFSHILRCLPKKIRILRIYVIPEKAQQAKTIIRREGVL